MNLKRKLKIIYILALMTIVFTSCSGKPYYEKDSFKINDKFMIMKASLHVIVLTDINQKILIPEKVSEIGFDSKYILIKQMGMKRENSYMIPDESQIYYWIINIPENKIHGPLDLSEYNELLKKENIPNMQLKDVKEYLK